MKRRFWLIVPALIVAGIIYSSLQEEVSAQSPVAGVPVAGPTIRAVVPAVWPDGYGWLVTDCETETECDTGGGTFKKLLIYSADEPGWIIASGGAGGGSGTDNFSVAFETTDFVGDVLTITAAQHLCTHANIVAEIVRDSDTQVLGDKPVIDDDDFDLHFTLTPIDGRVIGSCGSGPAGPTGPAGSGLATEDIDTFVELDTIVADEDLVGATSTNVLTNKTLDVEATGNEFSTVDELWIPAGINDAGTAGTAFDIPATGGPAKTAIDGSDTPVTKTMSLDFDATSDECVQTGLFFPTGTTSITAMIKWRAAATTNEAQFNAQTKCTGDAQTLSEVSWNALQSFAPDTAKGTTLQTNNTNALTLTLTGCAATELMRLRICRNADASDDDAGVTEDDDMTGDAQVLGVLLTIRRTL